MPGRWTERNILRLENIKVCMGGSRLFAFDSFAVKPGETVGLIGPSGCGKTTFLKLICGLLSKYKGKSFYGSVNLADIPPHESPAVLVWQSLELFPHMNVFENISYPLRLQGATEATIREETESVMKRFLISHLSDRSIHDLSGGEAQRVALARSLILKPPILLLDEPAANLDAALRTELYEQLEAAVDDDNTSLIIVFHDQREAAHFSDRVALMGEGKIHHLEPYNEILNSPSHRFVAKFLDIFNTMPVKKVDDTNETPRAHSDVGKFIAEKVVGKKPHKYSVRKDKVSLVHREPNKNEEGVEVEINEVKYYPPTLEVDFDIDAKIYWSARMTDPEKGKFESKSQMMAVWDYSDAIVLGET